MILFLIGFGTDITTILVISVLLFLSGVLTFRLSKRIFRKKLKQGVSSRTINLLSGVCAVLLSPIFLVAVLAFITYVSIEMAPEESEEEMVTHRYEMMEDEISEDLKVGMSKTEVVALFGENDTTKSVMVYDLSVAGAKEKYLLELRFEGGHLASFQRQR